MEAERAEGIVLRLQPITESSLIVTWFTRELGKLKTLAKGARRAKGPFRGKIDLFYRDELLFLRSRRSDLHLLHECFLEETRQKLRGTVAGLTAGSYACELVEAATEVEDVNETVFRLLDETLEALPGGGEGVLLLWFELQLLAALGWRPKWEKEPGVGRVLAALASAKPATVRRVRLATIQLDDARQRLWRVWDEVVGRVPRSRKLLAGQNQALTSLG